MWIVRFVGLVMLLTAAGAAWAHNEDPDGIVGAGVAWVLGLAGLACFYYTGHQVVVDGRSRTLTHRLFLGVPISFRSEPIRDVDEVLLREEWSTEHRTGRERSELFYPVELRSKKRSGQRLQVASGPDYELNRRKAVDVARALQLPLRDRPCKLIRTTADLDLKLKARFADAAPEVGPEPPKDSQMSWTRRGRDSIFEIPAARPPWIEAFMTLAPLLGALFFGFLLRRSIVREFSEAPDYLAAAGYGIVGLAAVVLLSFVVFQLAFCVVRTRIEVAPDRTRVRKLTCIGPRIWRFRTADVREVEPQPIGLSLRDAKRHVVLAEGCSEEEAKWLRSALMKAIVE